MDRYRTFSAVLKLGATVTGVIGLGLIAYYGSYISGVELGGFIGDRQQTYFLLVCHGYTLTTFFLLVTSFSKTHNIFFELVFHIAATICFFAGSIAFLANVSQTYKLIYPTSDYQARIAAGVFGFLTSIFHCLISIVTFLIYRSGDTSQITIKT